VIRTIPARLCSPVGPVTVVSLGLALVVAMGCFAASASAAVTGLERVSEASLVSSENKSTTSDFCPSGKQLLGAGGQVGGGVGQVALDRIRPTADLTRVTAGASEDETGFGGNWTVFPYAVCASPPPGLELVSAPSATDSVAKAVVASCPAGKRVLGAGGEITGGGGQALLKVVLPDAGLTSVTARGREDQNGTTENWSVTAYAVCANAVAGLERVVAPSPTNSDNKGVTATCQSGKQLIGAGVELGGDSQVVLDELLPSADLTNVRAAGLEDEDGTTSSWRVNAVAICANSSERHTAQFSGSFDGLDMLADCSLARSGTRTTGVGGDITGGGGQVRLVYISFGFETGRVVAHEDQNGYDQNWALRAFLICATPLPGLEEVQVASGFNSSSKSITVSCPAGKRVVGAGGGVDTPEAPRGPVLEDVRPNAALTSVTAEVIEDEVGTTENWRVSASAKCATPPPGLQLVSATSDPDSDPAGVPASCPPGKNLLGTGAEINGGGGQVVLDDVRPNAQLTTVTATALEDETGTGSVWSVRAHAICADP
jgi:hypothetical protein